MAFVLASMCLALSTKESSAKTECRLLENLLDAYLLSENRPAASIEDLRTIQQHATVYDGDPWGHPYIYEPSSVPRIRSAGPDGKPHTADDVTSKSRVEFSCVQES